jgi:HU domain fused to wHTH, Ig, or Glycine-rich motif
LPIRYQIISNSLKPGTFMARVIQGQRVGLDAMIEGMVARTTLSTADVQAVVTALTEEVRTVLTRGDTAVIDGLATFNATLSGSFADPDVTISRDTAQLNLAIQADSRLQAAIAAAASYERVVRDIKVPIITSFYDAATAAFDRYTPGSIVRLQGDHLKFDPSKLEEGVFLRNGGDEVRVSVYSVVGARQLDALVPATLSGVIQVVVRARYTPTGDLREGRFQRTVSQA